MAEDSTPLETRTIPDIGTFEIFMASSFLKP
jgi:hypothetical protein